jgi:hypothetical protein
LPENNNVTERDMLGVFISSEKHRDLKEYCNKHHYIMRYIVEDLITDLLDREKKEENIIEK